MLHVRGTAADYDSWAAASGDARWGARSMAEAEAEYEAKIAFGSKASAQPSHASPVAHAWVAAAGESALGNTSSYNTAERRGGFHYEHAVRRGVRQSTARQWLLPRLRGDDSAGGGGGAPNNLDVVVGAHVERVLLRPTEGAAAAAPPDAAEGPPLPNVEKPTLRAVSAQPFPPLARPGVD